MSRSAMGVTDVGMAVNAILHALRRVDRQQRVNKILMARYACTLRHASIAWFDLNRVFEVAQRER